ncbi:hypothetical protein DPMN_062683 [Dreissena polymorpha]|uniref:Uncharacterized protein n=2 Tax=Dreissena polymorpha TaxID=45954 RepID=A0A9D4HJJ8_DREPO|nr:hypothetical protein DPMN_062683 [Dreissena polymorpha]
MPGMCQPENKRTFWSFSQKTGSCVQITGCYTVKDRNVWLSRDMCRNRCLEHKPETLPATISNSLVNSEVNTSASVMEEEISNQGRREWGFTRPDTVEVVVDQRTTAAPATVPEVATGPRQELVVADMVTSFDMEVPVQPDQTGSGPHTPNGAPSGTGNVPTTLSPARNLLRDVNFLRNLRALAASRAINTILE